jgi:hypothetical protein
MVEGCWRRMRRRRRRREREREGINVKIDLRSLVQIACIILKILSCWSNNLW